MKLLINTESLLPPVTGIGTYTQNLLEQFVAMQALESIECFSGRQFASATQTLHERHARAQSGDISSPPSHGGLHRLLRNSSLAYRAREALRNNLLRLQSARLKNSVYHEPNFILRAHKGPCVATIHDLSFIHYPQHHPAKRVTWLKEELPKTLKRADFLITDSECVRQDLIANHNVPGAKVRTIYLGASDDFRPLDEERTRETLSHYNLTHGEYILFVGTLEPRKGIDILLSAWRSLSKESLNGKKLILAGAAGWNNEDLLQLIKELEQKNNLRHLQFVPDSHLPALYAGAYLFVYPSVYEGFGLPVLEAMRSGTPALCATGTAMAEFSNGSTHYFENGSSEDLAEQLEFLLQDEAYRQALAQRGLQTSQAYSWRRCAEETMKIYKLISRS